MAKSFFDWLDQAGKDIDKATKPIGDWITKGVQDIGNIGVKPTSGPTQPDSDVHPTNVGAKAPKTADKVAEDSGIRPRAVGTTTTPGGTPITTNQPAQSPASSPQMSMPSIEDIEKYASAFKKFRDDAMSEGRDRGEELFGNDALGRVGEDRSADIADILSRRKSGLTGYSSDELQGMRDQASNAINQQAQTTMRQLRGVQGASNVRGGLASAQQATALQDAARQRAQMEQELFIKNAAEQQARLGQYEGSIRGTEADELARKQYNQAQQARELQGKLATEMGYGGLASSDVGLASSSLSSQAMANALANIDANGKKGGSSDASGSGQMASNDPVPTININT